MPAKGKTLNGLIPSLWRSHFDGLGGLARKPGTYSKSLAVRGESPIWYLASVPRFAKPGEVLEMGFFRFRRSVKLLPGIRLNFNKKGSTITIGGRGAHVTFGGKRGTRTTVSIPGTGLSYTSVSHKPKAHRAIQAPVRSKAVLALPAPNPVQKEITISCADTGELSYLMPGGSSAPEHLCVAARAQHRTGIIGLLKSCAAKSQTMLDQGPAHPEALFQRAPDPPPPEPPRVRPPPQVAPMTPYPRRTLAQWIFPSRWKPIKAQVNAQRMAIIHAYEADRSAWEKENEEDTARRKAIDSENQALHRLARQDWSTARLALLAGSDPQAALQSIQAQIRSTPGGADCALEGRVGDSCLQADLALYIQPPAGFSAVCPKPVKIDEKGLALLFKELSGAELKRRYTQYVVAAALRTVAAALAAVPTLNEVTVHVRRHATGEHVKGEFLASLHVTRDQLSAGWKFQDAPLAEFERLQGVAKVLSNGALGVIEIPTDQAR